MLPEICVEILCGKQYVNKKSMWLLQQIWNQTLFLKKIKEEIF